MPRYEPTIEKRNDISWYAYDFTFKGQRYRGWLGAVSQITKRKASDMLREIYAGIVTGAEARGKKAPSKPPGQVFKEYATYLEIHKPKTYRSYKYISPHFEKFFTGSRITKEDIVEYKRQKLSEGLSGASINRHLSYCRAAYNQTGISSNPFDKHARFGEEERTRYLKEDELKALLEAVIDSDNKQLRGIVLTAILTGLRKDNILKLHARDIDFARKTITIPGHQAKGGKPIPLPLPDQLILLYKRYLTEHESGYVFENPFTHGPFGDVKHSWQKVLAKAGIGDFRFHDLRHTFATYALVASENLRTVQELLGHKNIRTTQKYTEVLSKQKIDAIKSLGDFIMGTGKAKDVEGT